MSRLHLNGSKNIHFFVSVQNRNKKSTTFYMYFDYRITTKRQKQPIPFPCTSVYEGRQHWILACMLVDNHSQPQTSHLFASNAHNTPTLCTTPSWRNKIYFLLPQIYLHALLFTTSFHLTI